MRNFKHFFLLVSFGALARAVLAQTVVDLENFNLPPNTFLNNASPEEAFVSGPVALPNLYDPQFMFWTGWAISNTTDTITPGFLNESSAMAGSGAEGTATYAVSYAFDGAVLRLLGPAAGSTVLGLFVTNNAYAYYSMRDGDAFAKKFGGPSGNDPDFFLLTVKKYRNGVLGPDSVNFYLADYRFEDNSRDYIVKEWTYIDLSSLGEADSLLFTLTSSDVGVFGMNTPAYFCIDQIRLQPLVSQKEAVSGGPSFSLYPNPASERVFVRLPAEVLANAVSIDVFDAAGRSVSMGAQPQQSFSVSDWATGLYYVRIHTREEVATIPLRVVR